MSEKEIEEILARFEKTDSLGDLEFLASNMQLLSGISNPKFADRINNIRSRVEKFCKEQAETALASNDPLSQNKDYPEAVLYADYAKILEMSETQENKELGSKLAEKANKELAAYDKEQGLENVDENTPFNQRYEDLNARIKPLEELPDDEIITGFSEKIGAENALDMAHLARMEVLSELALSGENLSDEEINALITERTQQLALETYTVLSTDCDIVGGFDKTINAEIEKLKQGEKIAELPENADLLTFTHYAMTHIEDEGETSLPDGEKYKALLEETLNDPEVLKDPEKLAALKYLIEHHNTFGVSDSDKIILKAARRLQQGAMYMSYSGVMANHTAQLQYRSTRIAQKTNSIVPESIQKGIAELEAKHPWVKVGRKALVRVGLTMASSALIGPAGPLLVSSVYAYKAFKKSREAYAAQNGGNTEGWVRSLFAKENLAKTISMAASPVISAVTFGMAGAGASALVSTVTRSVIGLAPSVASIEQQNEDSKKQQKNFEQKFAQIKTESLTDEEKKILKTLTYKDIANVNKMKPEQKAVWTKLDPKEREALEKEAQNIQKRKKAIGWTIGIAAGGLVLAAIGYEAKEHGWLNGITEKLHGHGDNGNAGSPNTDNSEVSNAAGEEAGVSPSETTSTEHQEAASDAQTQGNKTPDQSQDGVIPGHNPEGLINSIPDKQLEFAAKALAVSNKQGLVGMNNILKDIGYEGKIPNTSREMLDLLHGGNLTEKQQNALTDFIKENTYLDAKGQPHLTKDTAWNAFYENRLAEHQASLRSQASAHTPDPTLSNPTKTPTALDGQPPIGGTPDKSIYEIHHNGSASVITPETPVDILSSHDPVIQKTAAITEYGTQANPAVALSGKNATLSYVETNKDGYTVQHIEEHKGVKFIDEDKDGVADALKTRRAVKSSEVVTSPDGNVIETTETSYGRATNGESYVKNELVTSYDNNRICKTETDYFANGEPKKIVETEYAQGSQSRLSSVKETDCYANGTPKQVSTTKYIEGSQNKPLSIQTDLYHKGEAEPYATQVRQYDEFTGKQLSLKTTNTATGKVTTQSLASSKEIYQARAQVLNNWQVQANNINPSSPEYASLTDKIHRLAEAQRISATKDPNLSIIVGNRVTQNG